MLRSGCHVLILLMHMLRSRSDHIAAVPIFGEWNLVGEIPEKSEPNLLLKEGKMLNYYVFCTWPYQTQFDNYFGCFISWMMLIVGIQCSYATVDIRVVSALLVISTILLGFCLLMVQCEECEMWRLLYSPRKLSPGLQKQLSTLLEDYTYTVWCDTLGLRAIPDSLSSVCVRHIECYDPLEKLYFSMKYDPICICCCGDKNRKSTEGYYPQCELCADKTPIAKSLNSQFHPYVFFVRFVHPSTIYFSACLCVK